MIIGDGPEFVVMWHTRFFYSLLYELVEILNADELFSFSLRMIMSILHAGIKRTRLPIGLLQCSGGGCSATPPTLRLLVACGLRGSRPQWRWKRYSGVLEGCELDEESVV